MASSAPFSFLYGMCSLSVCGWRGAGLPAIGSGLDLDQDFARVDPIALGDVNRLDGPVDGSLNLAFHLHRLTHQHGLTGLDPVALGDQYIYDVPGHAGSHMSRLAGALTGLAGTTDKLVELGQGHFLRHAVDAQVEVPGAVALDADPGDIDAVALAMHIDHELGGHAFGLGRALVAGGDRQQHFRLQGAGGTLLKELTTDIREHGVGQHILLAFRQVADLAAQAFHLRLEQIRRAYVDHFLITDGADLYLRVDGARRLAVPALKVEFDLVGNGLVTLAGQHIEYGLGTDDLRGRGDQRRVAEVGAYPRDLVEHLVDAVQCTLLLKLVGQVGHHPARYLVDLHSGIHAGEGAVELVILLAHFHEVHHDFLNQLQCQPGVVGCALQRGDHGFAAGVAGAPGHGADVGVDAVGAAFDGLELAHGGQTGGVMGVNEYRQAGGGLERGDQFAGGEGGDQAGHVLDGQRIDAHRFQGLGLLDEQLHGLHRAGGVADGALGMLAGRLDRRDGGAEVASVVHRVEDAEHVDAVDRRHGDEGAHHVITVMAVAEQVLAAQQHLQAGIGQRGAQLAQALPGIFLDEAYAGVKGGATPDFQFPVA